MKPKTKEWATHKVATLSPQSNEKRTLMAIAMHSYPDGDGCWAKVETIAKYAGVGKRTCQRHLRILEARGEITIDYQAKSGSRTNCYSITVCRLSAAEREEVTGVSRQQIKLPLPQEQEMSELAIDKRSPEVRDEVKRLIQSLESDMPKRGGDPKPMKAMLWEVRTVTEEEENSAAPWGSGSVESDA